MTSWMPSTKRRVMQLELASAELRGVDRQPPFRTAVREVDDGGLPGHQRRKRADLVHVDVGVKPQAPLHRTAGVVVLHSIADKRGDFAVVALDGDLNLDLPLGDDQQAPHILGQVDLIRSPIEVQLR